MNTLDAKRLVEIKDFLKILKYVMGSQILPQTHQGRFYLVIKNREVGMTSDVKAASSAKKVVAFIRELINQILLEPQARVRSRYLAPINLFLPFIDDYSHASSLLVQPKIHKLKQELQKARVQSFVEVRFTDDVEGNPKDYGKYSHTSKTKTTEEGDPLVTQRPLTFEAYKRGVIEDEEKEAKKRGDQQISHFDKLIAMKSFTKEQVKQAFRIDLERELRAPMALQHLIGSFDQVLDHCLHQVGIGNLTALDVYTRFCSLLKEYIVDTNTETLLLDRELFRDIMGNRVKDGNKAKGPPSSFPFDTEEVATLIEEYQEGSWQDMKNQKGEVINPKELIYQNIQTQVDQSGICEMDQVKVSLDKVLKHPSFEKILQRIFNEVGGLSRIVETECSLLIGEGNNSSLDVPKPLKLSRLASLTTIVPLNF